MAKRNWVRDAAKAVRHGRLFAHHVVPAIVKPARTLWNEVIGFLFFCFALVFGIKLVRAVREFAGTPGDILNAGLLAVCFLLMGGFAVSSFLRARKISRS
jgi:hypothetical protein